MTEHTIRKFDLEIDSLRNHLLSMGGLVERSISDALTSLLEHDIALAKVTSERDTAINALEVEIDEMTRSLLVRHQPAAGDLRLIIAVIKVVTDLERMGDFGANIAEAMIRLEDHPPKTYANLESMGHAVLQQVNHALDAFSRSDFDLAIKIIKDDHKIDKLHKAMHREMLTYMLEDPRTISSSLELNSISKMLERIADHATNIAEMVIYITHGHDIRHVDHQEAAKLLKESESS